MSHPDLTHDQYNELFKQKASRMKETHVVCLEIYAERLYFKESIANNIYKNLDNVKMRIKFANFPCMEIDGTYEEEYIALETASIRTLRGTTQREPFSERDFFRRGRFSSASTNLKTDVKTRLLEKNSQLALTEEQEKSERKVENKKKVSFVDDKIDNVEEGEIKQSSKPKVKIVEPGDVSKENDLPENERKNKISTDSSKKGINEPSESALNIVKMDCGIPFNDNMALIFPITPHQLLYFLINRPMKVYIFAYINDKTTVLIGETCVPMYEMSDIVNHMILVEGGSHAVARMSNLYPMSGIAGENSEIGSAKMKIRLATYGVCSCAKLCTLDPTAPNIKFMSEEVIEDPTQELSQYMVRDAVQRNPIITGDEHTPFPKLTSKACEIKDKFLKMENKEEIGKFMCLNKWEDIINT